MWQREKTKYVRVIHITFHSVGTAEICYCNNVIFQGASMCFKACPNESNFPWDPFGELDLQWDITNAFQWNSTDFAGKFYFESSHMFVVT